MWGLLATLFATMSWVGIVTLSSLLILAIEAYVRNGHKIRRSKADLFA